MAQQAAPPLASVIGMSCRFPGDVNCPQDLMQMLAEKRVALGKAPPGRFCEPFESGFDLTMGLLDNLFAFDHRFFKTSEYYATMMDPQQRMALEATYEALQDAGLSMEAVKGQRVGVFAGIGQADYMQCLAMNPGHMNGLAIPGNYACFIANTVSFRFDINGPSVVMDTACSSSLYALDAALNSMANGCCSMAIVLGTNALLSAGMLKCIMEAGALSKAGISVPFDAAADGFCRAEGVAAIVLLTNPARIPARLLQPAHFLPHRAYAHVVCSGTNVDGGKPSATAPSPERQKDLIEDVHLRCGVPPSAVAYVEAHATGTPVGDPVEASSLGEALGQAPGRTAPLPIGSMKGNLGHTEPVAGLAGVIKCALMLQHKVLLPTAGFKTWNPKIDHETLNIRMVLEPEPLLPTCPSGTLYCGINSFGIGGANSYCLLAAADGPLEPFTPPIAIPRLLGAAAVADTAPAKAAAAGAPLPVYVIPLAVHVTSVLGEYQERWAAFADKPQGSPLPQVLSVPAVQGSQSPEAAFDAGVRMHLRAAALQYPYRSVMLGSRAELSSGKPLVPLLPNTLLSKGKAPRIGLAFSGQGTHDAAMAAQLWAHVPPFRAAVQEFAAAYQQASSGQQLIAAEQPTLRLSFNGSGADEDVRKTLPSIVMVQYALWRTLQAVGVKVVAAIGHSAGELLAAHVAGHLSLQQLCQLTHARTAALASLPAGAMMAVQGDAAVVQALLASPAHAGRLHLACYNSPTDFTLSGSVDAIHAIAANSTGLKCKHAQLKVGHAYHSPDVDSVLGTFADTLAASGWAEPNATKTAPPPKGKAPPSAPAVLVSSTTGQAIDSGCALGQAHWAANMRYTVQFAAAASQLASRCDVVLEVGPHSVLSNYLAALAPQLAVAPTVRSPATELQDLFATLGHIYLAGAPDMCWEALVARGPPGAPFPRLPWKHDKALRVIPNALGGGPSVTGDPTRPGEMEIPCGIFGPAEKTQRPEVLERIRALGKSIEEILPPEQAQKARAAMAASAAAVSGGSGDAKAAGAASNGAPLKMFAGGIMSATTARADAAAKATAAASTGSADAPAAPAKPAAAPLPGVAVVGAAVAAPVAAAAASNTQLSSTTHSMATGAPATPAAEAAEAAAAGSAAQPGSGTPAAQASKAKSLPSLPARPTKPAAAAVAETGVAAAAVVKGDHAAKSMAADGGFAALGVAVSDVIPVPAYCQDHNIGGSAIVPMAGYIAWTLQHALRIAGGTNAPGPVAVRDFKATRTQPCGPPATPSVLQLELKDGHAVWRRHNAATTAAARPLAECDVVVPVAKEGFAAGALGPDAQAALDHMMELATGQHPLAATLQPVPNRSFYKFLDMHSFFQFGPAFRVIKKMKCGDTVSTGALPATHNNAPGNRPEDQDTMLHPALVDGIMHFFTAAMPMPNKLGVGLPVGCTAVYAWPEAAKPAVGEVQVVGLATPKETEDGWVIEADILCHAQGKPMVFLHSQKIKVVPMPVRSTALMSTIRYLPVQLKPAAAVSSTTVTGWVGPAALLAALVPKGRRPGLDILLPSDSQQLAQAVVVPANVGLVVDARCSVDGMVATLQSAPAGAAYVALLLPPLSLECYRLMGYCRNSFFEDPKHTVYCITAAAAGDSPQQQLSAAALSAIGQQCLAAADSPELELVVTAEGTMAPRLVAGYQPLPPLPLPAKPAPAAPAAARQTAPAAAAAAEGQVVARDLGHVPDEPGWCLHQTSRGVLGSLTFMRMQHPPLQPDEVRIKVAGVALHFKDIMLAFNLLPGLEPILGFEISGTVAEIGSQVAKRRPHLKVGARVIAGGPNITTPPGATGSDPAVAGTALSAPSPANPGYANYLVTADVTVSPIPNHFPLVEAAGFLGAEACVHYALLQRARLTDSDILLIHSASGGIGQAALRCARRTGCRIIVSAGSPERRAALAALETPEVLCVLDSRNSSGWKEAVMAVTNGRGVDVLLNSLAGPLQASSLQLMAPCGRFVEIGKRDLLEGSPLDQKLLLRNMTFISAHQDFLGADDPEAAVKMYRETMQALCELPADQLPLIHVEHISEAKTIMRKMSKGQHLGKIVFEVPEGWAPPGLESAKLFPLSGEPVVWKPDLPLRSGAEERLRKLSTELAEKEKDFIAKFVETPAGTDTAAGQDSALPSVSAAAAAATEAAATTAASAPGLSPAAVVDEDTAKAVKQIEAAAGAIPEQQPLPFSAEGTIIVTGGTAGIGFSFVLTLMTAGARNVLLLSSRGGGDAVFGKTETIFIEGAREKGVIVEVVQCDVADLAAVQAVVASVPAEHPIEAVAHFATVYKSDGIKAPFPPSHPAHTVKALGAVNLHLATRHLSSVRAFLMCSSIARPFGHPNQVTYAMANQCLAGVVAARTAQGLPACLVDLPAVSESGHLSRWPHVNEALFASQMGVTFVPMRELAPKLLALLGDARAGQMVSITPPDVAASMGQMPYTKDCLLQLLGAGDAAVKTTIELAPGAFAPVELLSGDAAAAAQGMSATKKAAPVPAAAVPVSVAPAMSAAPAAAAPPSPPPPPMPAAAAPAVQSALLPPAPKVVALPAAPPMAPVPAPSPAAAAVAPVVAAPPITAVPPAAMPAASVPEAAAAATSAGAAADMTAVGMITSVSPPAAASAIVRDAEGNVTIAGHTVEQVREKILTKLAELLGTSPEDIPEHLPLADLGLDSLTAIELVNYTASEFGGPSAQEAMASGKGDVQQLELLTGMTLAQLMTKLTDAMTSGELERAAAAAAAGQDPLLAPPAQDAVENGMTGLVMGVPATGLPNGLPAAAKAAEGAAAAHAPPVIQPMVMQPDLLASNSLAQTAAAAPLASMPPAPPISMLPPPPLMLNMAPPAPAPPAMAAVPEPAMAYTVLEPQDDSFSAPATAAATAKQSAAAAPGAASAIARDAEGNVTIAGHTPEQVREKILTKLAELLGTSPEDIPEHLPLADLGLDSLTAIELVNYTASEFGGPSAQEAMASGKGDVQQLELLTGMTMAQLMTKLTDAMTSGELERAAAAAAAGQDPLLALPAPTIDVLAVPSVDAAPAAVVADGPAAAADADKALDYVNAFGSGAAAAGLYDVWGPEALPAIALEEAATAPHTPDTNKEQLAPAGEDSMGHANGLANGYAPMAVAAAAQEAAQPAKSAAVPLENGAVSDGLVVVERDGSGRVATIWLHAPSLTAQALGELRAALAAHSGMALILRSPAGGVFNLAADQNAAALVGAAGDAAAVCVYGEVVAALGKHALPVVVLAEGRVCGDGMLLCCLADIVVASSPVTFALPVMSAGGWPPAGLAAGVFGRRLPPATVRRLMLTGDTLNARKAEMLGVADTVAATAVKAAEEVAHLAARFADTPAHLLASAKSQLPPVAAAGV